ncbi:MAG: aromatic ring-hydroxylating dioxygenase subunit alpha [Proteobacteria bacterium]|nr:MAG: aromatic ring-hydroxylating dioxygenase subunit alpha [Pseudomonadota bacterium]
MRREDAETLVDVAAGSLVGDLLRRYWMPVAAQSELDERPVLPVTLLGEELVLYRDGSGTLGLVDRWCPHRRFDLAYGFVEPRGLRCSYHGWRFDENGNCVEQPYEDVVLPGATSKDRVCIKHYPVRAAGGLVFAYLGPGPEPCVPDWAGLHVKGYTVVALMHVPCNWVQIMENLYDPVHIEWLHDRWSYRLNGREVPGHRPRHSAFRLLDFDHGVILQRQFEGSDQWYADRTLVFPNLDASGGQGWHLTWIVPEDATHTLMVFRLAITSWHSATGRGQVLIPPGRFPDQLRIPAYRTHASLEPGAAPGGDMASHLLSQDVVSWLGSGPIADREREQLRHSDQGVVMFRKRLLEQARAARDGDDPQGVIRDREANHRITLPGARKNYGMFEEGLPGMVGEDNIMLRAFLPHGMPAALRQEIESKMAELVEGVEPGWWRR